ncbi:NRPS-like protein biosynthetic cluster [Apiospora rasikravindrae]|uniref:NRPS-like protein biosynthetic cluster n=1 Tax=Apiospora rasikravindrae TaxID=990691 RepID=A0ABR1TA91_9PEZI
MANMSDHGATAERQRTLLPHMVDQIASTDPDAAYGTWPVVPASYEAGYRTITYSQLANMVNGLVWWLVESLGGPGRRSEALAYVGPNDVRIPALGFATVKAGYSLFLTSPRNSAEAHRSLFESLDCKTLITPESIPPAAKPILKTVAPRHLPIPSVDELLKTAYPSYEYRKTLKEGLQDPIMIIHTSGSTGIPKPLIWTQETVLRHQNASSCPAPEGVPSLESLYLGKRVLVTLPPFHGAGFGQNLLYAVPFGNTVIAPAAAAAIVTAQGLVEALKQTPADIALLVPSVVAELAQNPELLSYCAQHLELIVYIGGDLPQQAGDTVAAAMPLRCQWGASEVGMPPQLIPAELDPRRDWKYIRFHPCAGMVFEKVSDNLYELVIQRRESLASTQPTFTSRGKEGLAEYRTRDLFAPHPSIPDAWMWQARADDIVVFLNGEKTNPITMEQHVVARNPGLVSGALVIGTHRFQAALLLEAVTPVRTTAEQAGLIERVWPSIEEANRVAPAHARVEKSMVFVTDPDRPLVRAGKGTLQRGASIALYETEINALYENADKIEEEAGGGEEEEEEATSVYAVLGDIAMVTHRIRDAVLKVTEWPALDDSDSLFERGMDSLQALRLTRALRRALHRPHLGLSTIYQNPTVTELATAATTAQDGSGKDDRDVMESLLATYRQLVHEIPVPEASPVNTKEKSSVDVILTGSTGTLGTMILRALLNRKRLIGHIFCLNRGPDGGRMIQEKKWASLDGDASMLEERVTFLRADLARPRLGLDNATYETLRSRVGLVIHGAWPVNFNLSLSAFRPQLAGMVNLFSFAAASTHRAQIMFISSIGAVAAASSGPTPESIVDSLDAAHANGYSRSKLLSELLCDTATRYLGIPTSIARVGQVAGPVGRTRGSGNMMMWNRSEWLPSLVISSFHLGCLPSDLGPRFSLVDWMPSDLVAEAVLDLTVAPSDPSTSFSAVATSPGVFNLRNPHTTTWTALTPALQDAARQHLGRELDVVPSASWLQRLEEESGQREDAEQAAATASVARNPAVKLLAFYRDGLWADGPTAEPMAVERSAEASATLRDMPAIQVDWMRRWVEDWLGVLN